MLPGRENTVGVLAFHCVRAPTSEQLQELLSQIIQRIMKALIRYGVLIEEEGMTFLADMAADTALAPFQSADCTYRIALGPQAGQKVLTLKTLPMQSTQQSQSSRACCTNVHGFCICL
ncbi:hypothetical protein SAMN05421863_109011 [Nitrosomonas communis]|uniref:Uncharacterized protein n=1 Tax=Nitrosomonas communis TaxID=44574 RepID=A0A1I4VTR6_9PROT|nr:hypothetical protein SAMN05421863_109011 [Nitrosomonas communis]